MPLFHSSPERQPALIETQEPQHSRSIFSRRSNTPESAPSTNGSTTGASSTRSGGFFGRRRSSSPTMGGIRNDSSVLAARQRVTDAEGAEREADRALMQARAAVRSARDQVKVLEQEALEEARRAKAKQAEAKTISKGAKALGRHG